jgi:hypothetical protein
VTFDKSRKVWTARPCKVITEDGFIKKIEVKGYDWPQTHARHGVNAHLAVLTHAEKRDGETYGDAQRWTILAGRLRGVETVARGVRIDLEGCPGTPAAIGPSG